MNEWIKKQLNHKTVRFFKDTPIADDTISLLEDVANHTASSNGLQQASIIRVVDKNLKKEISKVCQQTYVAEAPELWIFIADLHRNLEIFEESNIKKNYAGELERFFQSYSDALLMAQNVNNAVEMLDMGAVFLGSIQNNMGRMIELLDLPSYTAPVLGLAFGIPDDTPQLKPRMPKSLKIFENTYHAPENADELLSDYDQEMTTYYDTRDLNHRSDSFKNQVIQKLSTHNPRRDALLEDLANQGFLIERPSTKNESND